MGLILRSAYVETLISNGESSINLKIIVLAEERIVLDAAKAGRYGSM